MSHAEDFAWQLFRNEFRELYGSISILELSTNILLITHIKQVEAILREVLDEK